MQMNSQSSGIKLGKIIFGLDGHSDKFKMFKLKELKDNYDISNTKTINGSNNIICPFFDDNQVNIFDETMEL